MIGRTTSSTRCRFLAAPSLIAILASGPVWAGAQAEEESCAADFDEGGAPAPLPCTTFLRADLTGAAEAPGPGDPDGVGLAIFAADDCGNTLCVTYSVSNIDDTASGVHLHLAPPGAPGPIVVPFAVPVLTDGNVTVSECVAVANEALLDDIAANPGQYYFNFHSTPTFPAGAVRGQLVPLD